MDPKRVNIWYDPEGDFLEVMWADKAGEFIDTIDGQADVKVDDDGTILGFQIHSVSKITKPLDVTFEYNATEEEVEPV